MRIFGLKSDVKELWRRLHIEELYSFYRSHNIVRALKFEILRKEAHIEEGKSAFKILTG
jgi:hypothetical protein